MYPSRESIPHVASRACRPAFLGRPSNTRIGPVIFLHRKKRGCKSAGATCKLISMPELPDIAAYISALEPRIVGQPIERVRLTSPFLLRTVQPRITNVESRTVRELRRIG